MNLSKAFVTSFRVAQGLKYRKDWHLIRVYCRGGNTVEEYKVYCRGGHDVIEE